MNRLSGKEKIVQLDEGEVYGSVHGSSERVTVESEVDKKNKYYYVSVKKTKPYTHHSLLFPQVKDKWPLLLYTRGPLASLILSLQLHEYVEFCAVKRSSLLVNGTLVVRMPGSREEVMMEAGLTVSEKRRLFKVMKSVKEISELDGDGYDGNGNGNGNGDSNGVDTTTPTVSNTTLDTTSTIPNTTSNSQSTATWLRESFDVSADSRLGQLIFYCALRCPSLSHALSLPLPSALRALKALQGGLAAVGTDLVTCAWSSSELAQAAGRGVALRGAVQVMSATDCVEAQERLSRRGEVARVQPGEGVLHRWTVLVEGDSSFLGGECELFIVPPRSELNETDWTLSILQLPSETGYCSGGSGKGKEGKGYSHYCSAVECLVTW